MTTRDLSSSRARLAACLLAAPVALAVATALAAPVRADDVARPRLVVVIVVDSLSPMQIARVEDLFTGGLARLLTEGARFERCRQDHALTMNGPGHFTLMSSRHPGPAGMISNSWYDVAAARWVYCVEDSASRLIGADASGNEWSLRSGKHHEFRGGSSYRNVGASALGDWIDRRTPRSKIFSFSRKDRAAVLLAGRAADGAYWFDSETGGFVTSSFYRDELHPFVAAYNARDRASSFRHTRWERLIADTAIYEERARADSFPGEEDASSAGLPGRSGSPVFDHWICESEDVDEETFNDALAGFPFADVMTMELAMEAIDAEELGADDDVDVLGIALSTLDAVSHASGPLSQEAIDVVLRVDRLLGDLFELLDERLGSRYIVALSSDHGMLPLPEYIEVGHRELVGGATGRRMGAEASAFRARLERETALLAGGRALVVAATAQGFWIDWAAVREAGVDPQALDVAIRSLAADATWIDRIYSRAELMESTDDEEIVRRFRHSTHPSISPDYFVLHRPGTLLSATGTTHGTPFAYDAHVPLLIWGPGVLRGTHHGDVATVDLAPTLARLVGLERLPPLDGRVLVEALEPALVQR